MGGKFLHKRGYWIVRLSMYIPRLVSFHIQTIGNYSFNQPLARTRSQLETGCLILLSVFMYMSLRHRSNTFIASEPEHQGSEAVVGKAGEDLAWV